MPNGNTPINNGNSARTPAQKKSFLLKETPPAETVCHSEGALFATEESLLLIVETLRYAQGDFFKFYEVSRVRGSSASRKPSPKNEKDSTNAVIINAGINTWMG